MKALALIALCFAPVASWAQPANPWLAPNAVPPAPVAVAAPTPKQMPKYFVEEPTPSFAETLGAPANTPPPSRFAPADLDKQLSMASNMPPPPRQAYGSVTSGAPIGAPVAAQQTYTAPNPGAYPAAPPAYGYAGAPTGYNGGYYPTMQPYGSNGIPWGGNNLWPSFGNLPFGGSPNFGFW